MPSLATATPDLADRSPHRASAEVTVDVAIGRCWDALAEAATWTEWFPGMTKAVGSPPVWTAVGDTRSVTVNRLAVEEEAILVDRPTGYGFAIRSWPLPIGSQAVELVRLADVSGADGPRTRLTYQVGMELNLLGRLIWPVLKGRLEAGWRDGLAGLGPYLASKA